MTGESTSGTKAPRVPPRWFVRTAWVVHRRLYELSGGRFGLRRPRSDRWGMLRLTTSGRRTCLEHSVIVAYVEDGPNLVTLAMNGWAEGHPAWWRNLEVHPDATVVTVDGERLVRARAAHGHERERLWAAWREREPDVDAHAALRPTETPVVVLEPRYAPDRPGRERLTASPRPAPRPARRA
ncbi:MAG TPA: nitroreductase/quinone reductase family protein [Promicromonospora sp.]|nr:nitroreductase/quinone reductase family protein [Promicromonospora sp.]